MPISAAGIIFSGLNNNTISRLTVDRTVAAIPFGCRYRLVDFCLSNMVNANMSSIYVVVNYNYRSLIEHIGSGKDWDLARRGGGITVISPYQTATSGSVNMFSTHMQALKCMSEYVEEIKEEYVVMMDTDHILNLDLSEVVRAHKDGGAAITFVTQRINRSFHLKNPRMMISSVGGRIVDILMSSRYNESNTELSLNMFVMKTLVLRKLIREAAAHSLGSLTQYLLSTYQKGDYRSYCYDGYVATVSSFTDYYKRSMELVNNERARETLLWKKEAPIFTRVHNSSPTIHKSGATVKNSLIADECIIEGSVENSVIFRGVHIHKGAMIKNSVLFHGTTVGEGAQLDAIVTDKDVVISDFVRLIGNAEMPFYIPKNKKV